MYSAIPLLEGYPKEIIVTVEEILAVRLFINKLTTDESWKLCVCPGKGHWLNNIMININIMAFCEVIKIMR